jgi:glucokinase
VTTPSGCGTVLAIDLGGTQVKAELVGPDSAVLASAQRDTPRSGAADVLDTVCGVARHLMATTEVQPDRIGLAVPGIVDIVAGTGILSANLGWRNAPVARTVARNLGLPVVMAHDVTAAGLAEHRLGAGRGADDVVVVVVGTGISAALVVGGRIVTGGLGQAGELGHVVVRPDGPPCGCGRRGCLEAVSSAAAIARAYSSVSGTVVPGAEQVRSRLGTDPLADAVWAEAVSALADGLLTAVSLLGSSRIVVGGGLSRAGDVLLAPLRTHLAERVTLEAVPEVVPAELGARAGLVGAALAARDPRLLGAAVHQA